MRIGEPAPKRPRWALWDHQFDLVRTHTDEVYLTRWWIIATPWFGIALHRMEAGDARETVHDHPFAFVSFMLRGGYIERRLDPLTMTIDENHVVRRVNVMPHGHAHSIRSLLRFPTWTLLLIGRQRRTWGFWTPLEPDIMDIAGHPPRDWQWTQHENFDSGHYAPERTR